MKFRFLLVTLCMLLGLCFFAGCVSDTNPDETDSDTAANAKDDGHTYKYVDTYTLFDLIRQSGQGTQVSGD